MTGNQIAWINAMENKRANRAKEDLQKESNEITRSHNVADENIRSRSNDITMYQADITNGHYQRQDAETARSNLANEEIKTEANRINEITAKANKRNAATNARNADINQQNADTNAYNAMVNAKNAATNAKNAETNYLNYEETVRSNKAREGENVRHNLKSEQIEGFKASTDADYKSGMLEQTAYKNTADAVYQQGKLSNENKTTESEIALNEARSAESKSKADYNKSKAREATSKSVLNYVTAVEKGVDTFQTAWDALLKSSNNDGQMFFGFGGN